MFRLHEGWDYTLYKIYLGAGIAGLMGGPILAALFLGSSFPFADYGTPYMLGLTGWIAGILWYWWWVFLFKGRQALHSQARAAPPAVPPLSALQSLSRLHQAMILYGGDVEEGRKALWAGIRPMLEFYGWMNLLVVWILGAVWAGMLGWFSAVDPAVLPVGVVLLALIMVFRTNALAGRSAEGFAAVYLKPLGLESGEIPETKFRPLAALTGGQAVMPAGPAVIEGQRRGRAIRIEITGNTARSMVQGKTPHFGLHSLQGRLSPDGEAPETVRTAVKMLRKAKRWQGIRVSGGPQGIAIERQSHRQNMWLYDLWLAEYLLEKLEAASCKKDLTRVTPNISLG